MTGTTVVFEELLEQFRALGGRAENVRRDAGPRGYGIFPVDPGRWVKLHASENLLIPTEEVEVREGALVVRETAATGTAERAFFRDVHERFGWSAGTFEELWAAQSQWSRLPEEVNRALRSTASLDNFDLRFADPSPFSCLYHFVKSRDFMYNGRAYIAPVIDFVNHSSSAKPYVIERGVGVEGTFPGEVLVRYGVSDPWGFAMTYGFADKAPLAYSLPIAVDLFEKQRLSIRRDFTAADVGETGVRFPRKHVDGATIDFSFVMLGHARQPDLPRGIFRKLMSAHVTPQQADEVFDSILRFNHGKFLELLRTLRAHDAPLTRMLEDAAIDQLEALSANVGARSL